MKYNKIISILKEQNLLKDYTEIDLNINNISTTNPIWKIFKNSNIESTPVINNPNYKDLNNIFN